MSRATQNVAAAWAAQATPAIKGGNISFDGQFLYSYGEPIAAICSNGCDPANPKIVLVTTTRYSATTAAHKTGATLAALEAGLPVIEVDDVLANSALMHKHNVRALRRDMDAVRAKMTRARIRDCYQEQLEEAALALRTYAAFFDVDVPC
jgi:hypothetical protein